MLMLAEKGTEANIVVGGMTKPAGVSELIKDYPLAAQMRMAYAAAGHSCAAQVTRTAQGWKHPLSDKPFTHIQQAASHYEKKRGK